MSEVELQVHDGWAEVVLNRPQRKNAITGPLGEDLAQALNAASADPDIKALVLKGAGGAFCSGLDLDAFNAEPPPEWMPHFQTSWRGAHRALFNCEVPIIGAMERYAINGGAALAIACDLLVVGETSFLQVGEIQIGMGAPYNLAWLSLRHSEQVRAQVALLGDRLAGPELVRLGLAHVCVADDQVEAAAQGMAEKMAGFQGDAHRRVKAGLRAGLGANADTWFDRFTAHGGGAKPKRNVT